MCFKTALFFTEHFQILWGFCVCPTNLLLWLSAVIACLKEGNCFIETKILSLYQKACEQAGWVWLFHLLLLATFWCHILISQGRPGEDVSGESAEMLDAVHSAFIGSWSERRDKLKHFKEKRVDEGRKWKGHQLQVFWAVGSFWKCFVHLESVLELKDENCFNGKAHHKVCRDRLAQLLFVSYIVNATSVVTGR